MKISFRFRMWLGSLLEAKSRKEFIREFNHQYGRFQVWLLRDGCGIRWSDNSILINFGLICFFYKLKQKDWSDDCRKLDLSYYEGYFTIYIANKQILYTAAPWTLVFQCENIHARDGKILYSKFDREKVDWKLNQIARDKAKEGGTFRYQFVFKQKCSGELITADGIANYESRTWRIRIFPWFYESISLNAYWNEEMGSRRGSWKGGTIGTSSTIFEQSCLSYKLGTFTDWQNPENLTKAMANICNRCEAELVSFILLDPATPMPKREKEEIPEDICVAVNPDAKVKP